MNVIQGLVNEKQVYLIQISQYISVYQKFFMKYIELFLIDL